VQVLLNLLKNAITSKFERLPGISVAFIARCLPLMLQAQHFLYKGLCRFALQRPALDLQDIPAFYQLLHSSNPEHHRAERTWMLWTLENGFVHPEDYALMERRFAFGLLLSLHDSEAADNVTRDVVLKVILKICANPAHLVSLAEHHSLLAWFTAGIGNSRLNINALRKLVQALRAASASLMRSSANSRDNLFMVKVLPSKDKFLLELLNVAFALLSRLHHLLAQIATSGPATAVKKLAPALADEAPTTGEEEDAERQPDIEQSLESLLLETAHDLVMFVKQGADSGRWKMPRLPPVQATLMVSLLGWCATASNLTAAAVAINSVRVVDLLSLSSCLTPGGVSAESERAAMADIVDRSLGTLQTAISYYCLDSVADTTDAAAVSLTLLCSWAHWVLRLTSRKDSASKLLRKSLHGPETMRRFISLFSLLQGISSTHVGYLDALVAINSLFLVLRLSRHGEEVHTAAALRTLSDPTLEPGNGMPIDAVRRNLSLSMFFTAAYNSEDAASDSLTLALLAPSCKESDLGGSRKRLRATEVTGEKMKKKKKTKK
jgi:hypothetical protein